MSIFNLNGLLTKFSMKQFKPEAPISLVSLTLFADYSRDANLHNIFA